MKNKRLWIWLGGLALISAAFLLLNFRVAMSSSQTKKLIFTTNMGDNMPIPMQRKDKISVVLVGEGALVSALQKALTENMDNAGIGEIALVQELKPVYPNPVLVVEVGRPGPIWTPFLAMSRFSIHAGYASNGDYAFMDVIEKTRTSIAQKDVANMYAEFEVNDRSLGLLSRRGYHHFLADYLAQQIVAPLKDMYNG